MIRTRLVSAVVVGAALVPLLGAGGPDPGIDVAARRLVVDRAEAADDALAELERAVAPGLDAGRHGAALVVSGQQEPGAELRLAASLLADAAVTEPDARGAVRSLAGALRAVGASSVPTLDLDPGALDSIAAQLGRTADAADAFAEMRRRAEGLVDTMEEALVALEQGDVTRARLRVGSARADHAALAAWDVDLSTLPVWMETTGEMIATVDDLVEATAVGDESAALAAADAFLALAEEAAPADRALRIAIGEGGAAVTAAPLARLADLLREVAETRGEVASILQTVRR
jgi:hypothetical protein